MGGSPLSDTKVRVAFVVYWLLWAVLQTYALHGFGLSWKVAATDSILSDALLAGTFLLINTNLQFYRPQKDQYGYILTKSLLLAGLWLFVSYQGLANLFPTDVEYLFFLHQILPIRFGFAFLTIGWMTMISVLWFNRQDQKKQEERKMEAEKLAREAELHKLHQQLQPHFLFNSLNSISALVGSRPIEARKMIGQLSDFLRGTLKKEEGQWVSLWEELNHLQLYLEIEKVRFGHRLSTCLTCDEACNSLKLPPMLLQPIVENAIKFGLYDTTEMVTINIKAKKQDNMLVISVQNPFDPQTASPRRGTGFGLTGVQRRLYLLFARNDLLDTHAETQAELSTDQLTKPMTEEAIDCPEPIYPLFTTTLKIPQP